MSGSSSAAVSATVANSMAKPSEDFAMRDSANPRHCLTTAVAARPTADGGHEKRRGLEQASARVDAILTLRVRAVDATLGQGHEVMHVVPAVVLAGPALRDLAVTLGLHLDKDPARGDVVLGTHSGTPEGRRWVCVRFYRTREDAVTEIIDTCSPTDTGELSDTLPWAD
jgi:hypothetical protein